jgi:hypothetical protein
MNVCGGMKMVAELPLFCDERVSARRSEENKIEESDLEKGNVRFGM